MARLYGVPQQTGVGGGVVASVKIVGIPQLVALFARVASVARLEMGLLTAGAAQHMYALAQGYCPVVTGNLRSGIRVVKLASYSWAVSASSLDGGNGEKNGKEYAGYVENGTSVMGGRFFMKKAFAETSPIVYSDMALIARHLESL